jgi:hypothetical protein
MMTDSVPGSDRGLSAGVFGPLGAEVIRILSAIEQGDPQAAELLLPLVYDELRKLATQKLAQENPFYTRLRAGEPVCEYLAMNRRRRRRLRTCKFKVTPTPPTALIARSVDISHAIS